MGLFGPENPGESSLVMITNSGDVYTRQWRLVEYFRREVLATKDVPDWFARFGFFLRPDSRLRILECLTLIRAEGDPLGLSLLRAFPVAH